MQDYQHWRFFPPSASHHPPALILLFTASLTALFVKPSRFLFLFPFLFLLLPFPLLLFTPFNHSLYGLNKAWNPVPHRAPLFKPTHLVRPLEELILTFLHCSLHNIYLPICRRNKIMHTLTVVITSFNRDDVDVEKLIRIQTLARKITALKIVLHCPNQCFECLLNRHLESNCLLGI
jgi:hypothetical protein